MYVRGFEVWRGNITGQVDVRLPGKENANFHGARPVHLIIKTMKWIQTNRLSIKNALSTCVKQLGACLGKATRRVSEDKVDDDEMDSDE